MLREYMEKVIFLDKKKVPSPTGGIVTEFVDGFQFDAIFQRQSTQQQLLAQQQGLKEVYIMIVMQGDQLEFEVNDYVKQNSRMYRVVSSPLEPYKQAKDFPVIQYQVEVVEV